MEEEKSAPGSQVEVKTESTEKITPDSVITQTPKKTKDFSNIPKKQIALVFVILIVLFGLGLGAYLTFKDRWASISQVPWEIQEETKLEKFTSEEDFKEYVEEGEVYSGFFGAAGVGIGTVDMDSQPMMLESREGMGAPSMGASLEVPSIDRVSETTVQVKGIDEPDIVKTDGNSIYFSSTFRGIRPIPEPMFLEQTIDVISEPRISEYETKVIKAFPPADLEEASSIDKVGELLLYGNILTVISGNDIYGYDVSDISSPLQKWRFELDSKNSIVAARLYDDELYLVTQARIDSSKPCPVPIRVGSQGFSVNCVDIYHPITQIPADTTYTALVINMKTGETREKTSFVGTAGTSILYMSPNALYITYTYYDSLIDFFYNFFEDKGKDLISQEALDKISKLKDYEISDQSKLTELFYILENYYNSLADDERLRIENEFTNRLEDYYKENQRDFEKTGIVKIKADNLSVEATGGVPGRPLNQFSLDEYKENLRVATTIGGGFFGSGESANDIYVLNSNLKTIGTVLDMGLTERIYSVRFIEDKGYIVTFRQIDPFYVLDLSDPQNPEIKGELKIPGYSSYLHPISKDKILGIGKEGSKVKISLFDVENPSNPTEAAKYILDEYWSDVLNTHHAFLLDSKHEIFFLPGSRGGYIFSYKGDELELLKAVSNVSARRALYINDYMYIVGDNELVILNESDWTEVNNLEF